MKKILMTLCFIIFLSIVVALLSSSKKQDAVTIKYAAWNLGTIDQNSVERQMISAFNKAHANIKVEIDEEFVRNYDDAIKQASKKNDLPDVFMYVSNPIANANGWCADLSNLVSEDIEWDNIPKAFREAADIKGKIIAVPTSMYLDGYFYNEDLFNMQKVALPSKYLTVTEFKTIVEKMTNINNGSIGLADESNIIDWYPAAVNTKFGWYTWDGGKFNLNSSEFKAGVNFAKDIYNNKQSYAKLTEQDKKKLKGNNDWESWNAGTVALKFDGSWSAGDFSKLSFKVGFLGVPGIRCCVVPDFLIISKNSKYPKESYEFAKFMSAYSLEGFTKRLEISKYNNTIVSSLPMVKEKKIIDDYFSYIKIKGLKAEYDKIENNSYVEGVKVLPGYAQARWNYITSIKLGGTGGKIGDVLTNTYRGNLLIDDIAEQLNSNANESIELFPKQADN